MKKILIIEDDLVVSNIYRNKLAVEGYSVEIVSDGKAGLRMLESFEPDALILDLLLPKVSGIEILKQIRNDAKQRHLPVVVLSNTYLTSMVQEAWKAGATKCLSKASSSPATVLEVMRGLIPLKDAAANDGSPQPVAPRTPASSQTTGKGTAHRSAESDTKFIVSLPAALSQIRAHHQRLVKTLDEQERKTLIEDFYGHVRALTGAASLANLPHMSQMTEALEALARELKDKPKTINPSTLRTLASAIDLLARMGTCGLPNSQRIGANAKVLVVDDDAISRRAVTYSLEKARLNSVAVENPKTAMDMLSQISYDLVVLDIEMPEMNGYELCSRLRGFAANKRTPVVFVTGLNTFESRASSSVSGGNDFIGKPFLFIELAVKALVHIWRSRIEQAHASIEAGHQPQTRLMTCTGNLPS